MSLEGGRNERYPTKDGEVMKCPKCNKVMTKSCIMCGIWKCNCGWIGEATKDMKKEGLESFRKRVADRNTRQDTD